MISKNIHLIVADLARVVCERRNLNQGNSTWWWPLKWRMWEGCILKSSVLRYERRRRGSWYDYGIRYRMRILSRFHQLSEKQSLATW